MVVVVKDKKMRQKEVSYCVFQRPKDETFQEIDQNTESLPETSNSGLLSALLHVDDLETNKSQPSDR
jgi:hypothetical protein